MEKSWSTFCCNPFKQESHWVKNNLRNVTSWMITLDYGIKENMKICSTCRKKLSKARQCQLLSDEMESESLDLQDSAKPSCSKFDDPEYMDTDEGLQLLNASLTSIGESPVITKKCNTSRKYCKEKMEKIKCKLNDTFFQGEDVQNQAGCDCDSTLQEIIDQFKEKFKIASKNDKFLILTSLPKSWSCARIEQEFCVSNYTARKAKKLANEKGILSTAVSKPGKLLSQETTDLVKEFYCNDETSRLMPGKKDFVSVGKDGDGKPIHIQKRLILGNLREVYQLFKSTHPEIQIGFSKFADLRPKNCIIAGASGTHSVCVCTIHQNTKLMIAGSNMHKITLPGTEHPLKTFKDCTSKILCNVPNKTCFLNQCDNCPSIDSFKNDLFTAFEEEMVDTITYKQWITVDRCTFETITKPTEDFVNDLGNQLVQLKTHDFIAKQQSAFFSEKKSLLLDNEVIVQCDFAENYSFVLQDEAQGFHWTNSMATVHPCVIYFNKTDDDGKKVLVHKSVVFISDCLTHNTVLVHLFQKKLIFFLKNELKPNLEKVYYFSDGSAAQYKNRKNFSNLCYHEEDFDGVKAEWHFYATSHGKGACDGVGGTIKRLAAKASLQNPINNQILSPHQLFEWGTKNIPSVNFFYVPNQDYVQEEKILEKRFNEAITVTGTQKYHTFIPETKVKIKTKVISDCETYDVHKIQVGLDAEDVPFHHISGYVACAYDNKWWMAYVLSKDEVEEEINVSFLHPYGPAPSFTYPRKEDLLTVPKNFIVCNLNPTTATGRTYSLNEEEIRRASRILAQKINRLYQ